MGQSHVWRGVGQIAFRTVPAVVGGIFGGYSGAKAGYSLGQAASGAVFNDYNNTELVKNSLVSAYDPMSAYTEGAVGRTMNTNYTKQVKLSGLEKFGQVSDAVNAMDFSALAGSGKKGEKTDDLTGAGKLMKDIKIGNASEIGDVAKGGGLVDTIV